MIFYLIYCILFLSILLLLICILLLIKIKQIEREANSKKLTLEEKIQGKLPLGKYKVLKKNNVMSKNKVFIIDFLVVSIYGIFIFNIKRCYGILDGDEYNQQLIRTLYSSRQNVSNPLYENHLAVNILKKYLEVIKKYLFIQSQYLPMKMLIFLI